MLRSRARTATLDESVAKKIQEHQHEMIRQKQKEGMSRFAEGKGGATGGDEKAFKRFESYRRENQLPSKVDELRIMVDNRAQSVILPIHGFAVPFHVKTLKNVSKSDEGEYTYLRINFVTPGQLAGKKEDVPFDDPDATFIRNISYRSTDARHFEEVYQEISEMRRLATKREAERREMADVVEQDELVLNSTCHLARSPANPSRSAPTFSARGVPAPRAGGQACAGQPHDPPERSALHVATAPGPENWCVCADVQRSD